MGAKGSGELVDISAEQSVEGLTAADAGKFLHFDGTELKL